jgi:thiol:disulfide interchange protein DsbD
MQLQGNIFDYPIVFFKGVLVSFSPCIYPLIPVTISYLGVSAEQSKLKGFLLSLIFVFGIALTYSVLGFIAAITGKLFGQITANPITYFLVGNIYLFFGLSLMGLFDLPFLKIPLKIKPKSKGYLSCLFLGISSGLVISPCVSPILGAILSYVATKQNLVFGATLLFVFAYGMGTLLIIVGTSTSILLSLPKPGIWQNLVKKICGLILIFCSEYFLILAGTKW